MDTIRGEIAVSVPSRGILFPNSKESSFTAFYCSFRPLSGYLISKCKLISCYDIHIQSSFRPLSGYLISKYGSTFYTEGTQGDCFRPLSGYLISKYSMSNREWAIAVLVSVPSRGILFPNIYTNLYI